MEQHQQQQPMLEDGEIEVETVDTDDNMPPLEDPSDVDED